jgi:hypothetical protein
MVEVQGGIRDLLIWRWMERGLVHVSLMLCTMVIALQQACTKL